MRELILKLNREYGITFLVSSHILDELARLATHYGFIDKGCLVKEISAAELEASYRKCIRVEVSDTKILSCVLDRLGIEYVICSDKTADIYGNIILSQLVIALADKKCDLISSHERDESLETYFINLVGGEKCE